MTKKPCGDKLQDMLAEVKAAGKKLSMGEAMIFALKAHGIDDPAPELLRLAECADDFTFGRPGGNLDRERLGGILAHVCVNTKDAATAAHVLYGVVCEDLLVRLHKKTQTPS